MYVNFKLAAKLNPSSKSGCRRRLRLRLRLRAQLQSAGATFGLAEREEWRSLARLINCSARPPNTWHLAPLGWLCRPEAGARATWAAGANCNPAAARAAAARAAAGASKVGPVWRRPARLGGCDGGCGCGGGRGWLMMLLGPTGGRTWESRPIIELSAAHSFVGFARGSCCCWRGRGCKLGRQREPKQPLRCFGSSPLQTRLQAQNKQWARLAPPARRPAHRRPSRLKRPTGGRTRRKEGRLAGWLVALRAPPLGRRQCRQSN